MSDDLNRQIKLNDEMISNLKEFFGSYLSNFLKEYRNKKEDDPKLKEVLSLQDKIYDKFHKLMKEGNLESMQTTDPQSYAKKQQQIIEIIKKFFSSNSKFIKLYRKGSKDYGKMEQLLEEQQRIFDELSGLLNNQ